MCCVQGYGFPVNRLFDLLFEVRDQYNETLLKKWALVFRWALVISHLFLYFIWYFRVHVVSVYHYSIVIFR